MANANIAELRAELAEFKAELKTAEEEDKPFLEKAIKSIEKQIADAERDDHHAKGSESKPTPPTKKTASKSQKDKNGNLPDPSEEDVRNYGTYSLRKTKGGKYQFVGSGYPGKVGFKTYDSIEAAEKALNAPTYTVKGKGEKRTGSKVGFKSYPSMKERVAETTKAPKEAFKTAQSVMIKCEFKAIQNQTENPQIVNILGDEQVAYPGDYVLYRAEDNYAFTVLAESTFKKRCVNVSLNEGDKVQIVVKKATGCKSKVTKNGQKDKTPRNEEQKEVVKDIKKQCADDLKDMKKKGINPADLIANIKGSPLENYLFSEAKHYNDDDTDMRIVRMIATTDGHIYVGKQSDTVTGIIRRKVAKLAGEKAELKWYRVCPTRGIETGKVDYDSIKGKKVLPKFGDEKVTVSLLKKVYDYPEQEFPSCRSLASQYYEALKDGDTAELKKLSEKYKPKCLLGRWREEYTAYNKRISNLAKEYITYHPRTKYAEARKKVLEYMAQEYRKQGGKVNIKEIQRAWIADMPDDRDNF